jgi:hypothetical protein
MTHMQGTSHRKTSPGMRAPYRRRPWQLAIWLLLLILIAAPVGAAPVRDDPTPPAAAGLDTGTEDQALVEFRLPNRAAIDQLVALDADLAEYVRENDDGTVTINAFVTPDERALYESMGFQAGATIEDRSTWEAAKAEREAAIAAEKRARTIAQGGAAAASAMGPKAAQGFAPIPEITIQRVDYFTNYAGRFLSVEAKDALGTNSGGPTLAMAWAEAGGDYGTAANMSKFTDSGQYMYHTMLVRIGAPGETTPLPAMVRVASSTGEAAEAPVNVWLGGGLPPMATGYLKGFLTHYMDPAEGRAKINALAAEFPNIAEIIDLPNDTNGYQRKSMAIMNGTGAIGSAPSGSTAQSQAVVLFAQAWGQEGGNDVQAEFLNPGAANSPLAVSVSGLRITVNLGTSSTGALVSTAAQVRDAINANLGASALVTAYTWNNGAGAGIVQPRALVNLSDFLSAPLSYPRGPFHVQALRIGAVRDGSKVGVFIYCEQHAREWVTPNVCLETAERLVRNYAIDPATKAFIDNLNIIIVPAVNADGSAYSFYDYGQQRKNMTDYCPPTATSNGMPSNRNSWGVDINRNGRVGTVWDGYSGASATSCTSSTFAGPAPASEPEFQNLIYVDEHFNIKYSMNVHSSGGYFMWPPGAYIASGRVTLPAPNIGVEKYFWAASDRILNRVKEERGTAILPGQTGAVVDVLYSAAGNTADDEYYNYGILGWDFEVGAGIYNPANGRWSDPGFQPNFAAEGNFEAMEFASGNYGLLETALAYALDTTPPVANIVPDGGASRTPIQATFEYGTEPSVIYYTLDGSDPTLASTKWEAQGPRQPGQIFQFEEPESPVTLKWIAQDIKGNVSEVRSALFVVDSTPPLLAPTVTPNPVLLYGTAVADPNATDNNSGVASASCEPVDTSSVGLKTLTCTATDNLGNTASATVSYNVIYGFSGFTRPVDNPPALNTANAGSIVALKWQLTDANGAPITDLAGVAVKAESLACDLGTTPDQPEESAAGKSGLQNMGGGYYQWNWATPKAYAESCKTMKLDLAEGPGMERTALFQFPK